jgi:hypothetical protein
VWHERGQGRSDLTIAATASDHCAAASARETRNVDLEMALKVEAVVDDGMHAEEDLGGSG